MKYKSTLTRILLILAAIYAIGTASASIFLNSFNSGQLSKDIKYRHDLERTPMGSEQLENILIRPQGMAYKRPGTEFIANERGKIIIPEVLGDYPLLREPENQDDPGLTHIYAISSRNDLEQVKNAPTLDGYYLTQDIDLSGVDWDNEGIFFRGTLDGCGYSIQNMKQTITDAPSAEGGGLFVQISGTDTVIANLTLSDVDITTNNFAGSFTTFFGDGASMYNCHATGTITLHSPAEPVETVYLTHIGGMIGSMYPFSLTEAGNIYDSTCSVNIVSGDTEGTAFSVGQIGGFIGRLNSKTNIQHCKAYGDVDVSGFSAKSEYIGGFLGYHVGSIGQIVIQDCNAYGDVRGDYYVGGFFGGYLSSASDGFIQECAAHGDVTALEARAGGFAGTLSSSGKIYDCFAWGDVTAPQYAGGFAGRIASNAAIWRVYSIGAVTGDADVGGLVGDRYFSGIAPYSYWDTETSGQAESDLGTGYPTVTMKTKSTYVTWDFDDVWYMEYTPPGSEDLTGNPIRLIPFEYSTNDAYVLEFGHEYIGFLRSAQ